MRSDFFVLARRSYIFLVRVDNENEQIYTYGFAFTRLYIGINYKTQLLNNMYIKSV